MEMRIQLTKHFGNEFGSLSSVKVALGFSSLRERELCVSERGERECVCEEREG